MTVTTDRMGHDPIPATLTALLAERTADSGDAEFLRFEDWSWTFGEIDTWTSRLAHRLIRVEGVKPGDRVAVMLPNVVQWPVFWLAALKAGAVVVPINSAYQRADLEFVLTDSGARVVVTDGDHLPLVRSVLDGDAALADVQVIDVAADGADSFPATAPDIEIDAGTLANLQYTSGTTGFPKACMLTHDYWVRNGWLCASATGLNADDVLLTAQPFSYMDPLWNVAAALTAGAPLVVLPRFSASGFFADVRRHRATFLYVLGSMPTLLLKQPPDPHDRDNDLRLVWCSAIPAALHADLEHRWGAPWRELYGMTESGFDMISPLDDVATVGTGAVGVPVPTKQVRVVDGDGAEVPDGEPGELAVRGRPMMLGYWNRPEETARVLRRGAPPGNEGVVAGGGWLHTGDLVVRGPDGSIRIVGRIKDMVRRGGENVASVEVEAALERDPSVVGAAVVPEPDEVLGEEVKVFVQLADGIPADRATAEAVIERAGTQLARFKVPRYVEFVDGFPRTPSERVSKPALRERAATTPGTVHDLRPGGRSRPAPRPATQGYLDVSVEREVAILTLCRPEKLNALDVATRRRLASAVREHGTGATVRGIVLTGTGRAFSAGEDLTAIPSSYDDVRVAFETFHDITRAILETRVPVIAAVNGLAVGGASEITLCCDARIGTPATEFYQPENARGITISNASSVLLPRLVRGHALGMVLGAGRLDAQGALRIGLLDEIVDPDQLVERAIDSIVSWTPPNNTTAQHLELLRPGMAEVEAAFAREDVAAKRAWDDGVYRAGIESFWEGRKAPGPRGRVEPGRA